MAMVLEFLGLSPAGLNGIPAEDPAQGRRGARACRRARDDARAPRHPPAPTSSPATRSRTRSRGGRDRRLDQRACCTCWRSPREFGHAADDRRVRRGSPTARRSSPTCGRAGTTPPPTCTTRGGVALVMRELLKADLLHGDATTVDGRTIAKIAAGAVETPGQEVVRPIDDADQADRRPRDPARQPRAGRLRGQARRPRAAPAPRAGARLRLARTDVLRGGQRAADQRGRRGRDPLRGPGRRTRDAGDAGRDRRRSSARASAGRVALLTDGRFSGGDARPDDRPRRAGGGGRRPDRARRAKATSIVDRRRRAGDSTSRSPTTCSPSAARAGRRRAPRYTTGVIAKYAALVSSASEGAVTSGAHLRAALAVRTDG